jgi:4-hydroxy-tetrahydrodipicolinate synthase
MKNPGRIVTAMVTPFDGRGRLSKSRTRKLVDFLLENKTDCILVSGTTGESPTLSDDEKLELLGWVREFVPGDYPIMFGAGTNSTSKSIELSKKAKSAGADFLLLVVPYYNKPTQDGIYRHFMEVVESVHMKSVVYNIPSRTGVNMNPETVLELAEHDLIIGIKEASGNLDAVSTIRAVARLDFLIYSGDDSLTLPMLSVGADGVISVASHLVGKMISEMIESYFDGRIEDAKRIHLELFPLFKGLFYISNPIPVKTALNLMGIEVGGTRPPLYKSDDASEKLAPILAQYGLIST